MYVFVVSTGSRFVTSWSEVSSWIAEQEIAAFLTEMHSGYEELMVSARDDNSPTSNRYKQRAMLLTVLLLCFFFTGRDNGIDPVLIGRLFLKEKSDEINTQKSSRLMCRKLFFTAKYKGGLRPAAEQRTRCTVVNGNVNTQIEQEAMGRNSYGVVELMGITNDGLTRRAIREGWFVNERRLMYKDCSLKSDYNDFVVDP
ncbi:unnamed protein product [Nippostrongylus brasiliensis]|uniref:DDE_Tnp_1_7 domain-containing protein n=1 Tax=Nippostrongylus brasiliensis TaxID=27835 RepID=A0A0N4YKA5_NIPBR|nr:unnamed protein product [Nippostrongylus brasiliensis]